MEDGDLFPAFDFSDPDDDNGDDGGSAAKASRAAKLQQSEDAFAAEKDKWRPVCRIKQGSRRLENAQSSASTAPTSREEILEMKAAAEERYYFRRFEAALGIVERALLASGGRLLHPSEEGELLLLQERCKARLGESRS